MGGGATPTRTNMVARRAALGEQGAALEARCVQVRRQPRAEGDRGGGELEVVVVEPRERKRAEAREGAFFEGARVKNK